MSTSIRALVVWTGLLTTVPVLAGACGASDDPRCDSLCTVKDKNYGDVCSADSAASCLDQCDAQVSGVESACASCLLEDAHFSSGGETVAGNDCQASDMCGGETFCTLPHSGCTYCNGDEAAREACLPIEFPKKEVSCKTSFRDPAKCSALCGSSGS